MILTMVLSAQPYTIGVSLQTLSSGRTTFPITRYEKSVSPQEPSADFHMVTKERFFPTNQELLTAQKSAAGIVLCMVVLIGVLALAHETANS